MVFADVEEDTGNLDPEAAEAALTARTRVVAAVDYAGHPAEYDELREVADAAGRPAARGRGALHRLALPRPAGGHAAPT